MIKEEILHDFDFSNFDVCVDCIKGKLPTKVRKGKKNKKQDVLKLIHTNISEPLSPLAISSYKYFITFIYDYSNFGWVKFLQSI